MRTWKKASIALLALAGGLAIILPVAAQQAGTQFMGILGYRVGPYGANGAAFFTGFLDYLNWGGWYTSLAFGLPAFLGLLVSARTFFQGRSTGPNPPSK